MTNTATATYLRGMARAAKITDADERSAAEERVGFQYACDTNTNPDF